MCFMFQFTKKKLSCQIVFSISSIYHLYTNVCDVGTAMAHKYYVYQNKMDQFQEAGKQKQKNKKMVRTEKSVMD